MEQKIFSKLIFEFLEKSFPEFVPSITYNDDDSFDCKIKSPSGKFSIWIATYNCEITFGMEAPDGKADIHTHVSCYEIDDLDDCVSTLSSLIDEIRSNKVIIYCNDANVYDWIEHNRLIQIENKKGVTLQKLFWNEKY